MRIPKLTAEASVGFVAESQPAPEADVTFGEITLLPSTLKSVKVLIRFSNELLRQTDADSLLDAIALASAAEVMPNRWFINGADFIALRMLKDLQGRYLIESDVTYRLFGIPVTVTNKLAVGKAVLADTSQIAVARDLAPSVTLLSERYADYDEHALRAVTRYDLGLLHPEAVIVLSAAG